MSKITKIVKNRQKSLKMEFLALLDGTKKRQKSTKMEVQKGSFLPPLPYPHSRTSKNRALVTGLFRLPGGGGGMMYPGVWMIYPEDVLFDAFGSFFTKNSLFSPPRTFFNEFHTFGPLFDLFTGIINPVSVRTSGAQEFHSVRLQKFSERL